MTKNEKPKKNLIKLFSNSSYRFISDFLNDSAEKRAQEQANENIFLKLKMASLQNLLYSGCTRKQNNTVAKGSPRAEIEITLNPSTCFGYSSVGIVMK